MRKNLLLWLALLVLAVSACTPQASTPQPTATSPVVASPTAASAEAVPDCTISSVIPTPGPTLTSLFPAPSEDDWIRGSENARITFTEYSDFQCPGCGAMAPILAQIEKEYPEDVRVVYRHYPLNFHPNAILTAQAAEAAGVQGKFWEMHDLLFNTQQEWSDLPADQLQPYLEKQAQALGLDVDKFKQDLTSEAIATKVKEAQAYGEKIGIPYTPFLLINGQILQIPEGADPYSFLKTLIPVVLMQERQFTTCPEMTIDPSKQYIATLKTEKGDIVMQLFPDKAPLAVNSFVFLARNGWFDNVTFHRVVSDPDVAQTGDPSGTGWGGPGYAFRDEITDLKFDKPGMVGMANSGPNTNGSQFFIIKSPIPYLDGKYTIFAQVIKGMDVVNQLTKRDPSTQMDAPLGDKILSVSIEEK